MAKLLIFNNDHGIKLLDDTINDYELVSLDSEDQSWRVISSWTHVIWDARGCTLDNCEKLKEILESFCLLKSLDIVDTTHNLREWVESIGGTLHLVGHKTHVRIPGFQEENVQELPSDKTRIIVSNVCWDGKDNDMFEFLQEKGINEVNVALSVCSSNINVHNVRELKKKFDEKGIKVVSLNAIYYTIPDVSIFNSFEKYVLHFKKYIHFASILEATYIIYGSSSSKCVHTSKKTEYEYYKYAYDLFKNTLKQIGTLAKDYNIKIILKANTRGNFIFEDSHAQDMVGLIDCENVTCGPSRPPGPLINYGEFTLIEFPPTTITKAKTYIEHCLKTLLI